MPRFDPVVRTISLDLPRPGAGDNRSYESRIRSALEDPLGQLPGMPLSICKVLPEILPFADYRKISKGSRRQAEGEFENVNLQALVLYGPSGWEVARISAEDGSLRPYGLAVDLGTTTVVFNLVDLSSGEVVSTLSELNPQSAHGEDILDRIHFAGRDNGSEVMQSEIVGLINSFIEELASGHGIGRQDIYFITLAGNTTMCHLLMGLDPSHICREPYVPVVNRFDLIRSREIGINIHPQGWIYCFPNVGSYFGGDLMAGILASGMHLKQEISMLVDVGTNAEVVLGNRDWLIACAGAAGPALEGGILHCGLRAKPGAIDRVDIDRAALTVKYHTIDDKAPDGLCGSGVIDLLASMFTAGLVNPTGKLIVNRDSARMQQVKGEWVYVVAGPQETCHGKPVYISQSDIKNLIRSKAAMYTMLNVVVQSVGITFEDIERFYIAGAFGNYIDPVKAITIGMLPEMPLENFEGIGNAAGTGAIEALRWKKARDEVENICNKTTYLEMNVRGDFMSQLTGALFLPHTDLTRFPSAMKAAEP